MKLKNIIIMIIAYKLSGMFIAIMLIAAAITLKIIITIIGTIYGIIQTMI